jgi:hypothetical protein
MFSTHRSEVMLPVDVSNGTTPYALTYVAGVNYKKGELYFKTSNFGEEPLPLALEFGADWNVKNATVEILSSSNRTAWNAPNVESPISPEISTVDVYGSTIRHTLPP